MSVLLWFGPARLELESAIPSIFLPSTTPVSIDLCILIVADQGYIPAKSGISLTSTRVQRAMSCISLHVLHLTRLLVVCHDKNLLHLEPHPCTCTFLIHATFAARSPFIHSTCCSHWVPTSRCSHHDRPPCPKPPASEWAQATD